MLKNDSFSPQLSLQQKFALIFLGLFLALVLLEFGLRLVGTIYSFLQEHDNKIPSHQKDSYRIMCLGESTTALGGRDSYPSQLEKILNEHRTGINFSVINKGAIGSDTSYIVNNIDTSLIWSSL